ncbi:hypothetical protein TRM7615_01739 [Falsiruegeria mediterranea M17]|uniref:DUF1254 domain-containing protein n=1 Tax=Falsiruegeria mediterranea M17 TaxID=1200281 RepID=A0A2R8C761_9RHOB|nr:hypothetical protein TRM7615_01739 [Falsiruegeria mediterranea M17]
MIKTMRILFGAAAAVSLLAALPFSATAQETIETRIGELGFTHSFEDGYPTDQTRQLLFDEMDFQRATQAYIWSIPMVSMARWRLSHEEELGAENGQIVFLETYADKIGGLTYNATTPYVLPFIDLAEGPWVLEMPGPDGAVRGAAHDMWQIGITRIAEPGKYLFVGPGQEPPEAKGYDVHVSPTNGMLLGIRLMPEDRDARMALLDQIEVYPWSERDTPKTLDVITPDGRPWMAAAPLGMEYWELLNDTIQREPVHERDRFIMAMLKPLGIEKGKPFKPDWRQQRLLLEAAIVGEAMAKANDFFNPRIEDAHYRDGSNWEFATVSPPDQRREFYDELDGRAAWFYEAVTNDPAMHGQKTGKGQVYLAAYKDADGDWLDGGTDYVLRVPADAPAEAFWSITLYEVSTRTLIQNAHEIADRSSRMDLAYYDDGSVDI